MGRVVQTPLAAIGLLTRAPRSAAAIAHRLLSGLYACRRSVTSPVSRIKTGGGSGLPGKRDLLRDEVQKAPTSVMIICSTKIKVSGRLSGKTCSRGPIPSLRVLAWARVFPGQCGLPAAIEPDGGSW
jgi:hypothetical protein